MIEHVHGVDDRTSLVSAVTAPCLNGGGYLPEVAQRRGALAEPVRGDGAIADRPNIRHLYALPPGRRADIGDKALCGHVKRNPAAFASNAAARASGWPMCVVCDDLSGGWA